MIWFVLSAVVIVADQLSKYWISETLQLCIPGRCESIELLPVFEFTLLHNSGAAFSFLADQGGWQRWFLLTISVVFSVVLAIWLYKLDRREKMLSLSLALILGGAIGNLIDRALLGYVVDFVVVHYELNYFPAFNVADAAITVGAGFLILDTLLTRSSQESQNAV